MSADKLRLHYCPKAEATVMSQGIYFRACTIVAMKLFGKNYLDKARNLGRFKIKIHMVTTNYIWLKDAVLGDIVQLDINDQVRPIKIIIGRMSCDSRKSLRNVSQI